MIPKYYIGIDPDTDKSGVACIEAATGRILNLYNLSFFQLLDYLQEIYMNNCEKEKEEIMLVVIEASWLLNGQWYPGTTPIVAKIARAVGANHQVGRLLAEYCSREGIPFELSIPKKGRGEKINASDFAKKSLWTKRTNEEQRDAAMLVLNRT